MIHFIIVWVVLMLLAPFSGPKTFRDVIKLEIVLAAILIGIILFLLMPFRA